MIVNVHRKNTPNRGDLESAPCKYLVPQDNIYYIDILECSIDNENIYKILDRAEIIILGGGGLLDNSKFEAGFKFLKDNFINKLVIWGVGSNYTGNTKSIFSLDGITHVGLRDKVFLKERTNFDWVPCASCLHPLFTSFQKKSLKRSLFQRNYGLFINNSGQSAFELEESSKVDSDVLGNFKVSIYEILDFIVSSKVMITTSYHGVYWSMLLGNEVFAKSTSIKFKTFKYDINLIRSNKWWDDIYTYEQPSILKECRDANISFFNKIKNCFPVLNNYKLSMNEYGGEYIVHNKYEFIPNKKLSGIDNNTSLELLQSNPLILIVKDSESLSVKYLNQAFDLCYRGFSVVFTSKERRKSSLFSLKLKRNVIGFPGSYINVLPTSNVLANEKLVVDIGVYLISYRSLANYFLCSKGYSMESLNNDIINNINFHDFFLENSKNTVAIEVY